MHNPWDKAAGKSLVLHPDGDASSQGPRFTERPCPGPSLSIVVSTCECDCVCPLCVVTQVAGPVSHLSPLGPSSPVLRASLDSLWGTQVCGPDSTGFLPPTQPCFLVTLTLRLRAMWILSNPDRHGVLGALQSSAIPNSLWFRDFKFSPRTVPTSSRCRAGILLRAMGGNARGQHFLGPHSQRHPLPCGYTAATGAQIEGRKVRAESVARVTPSPSS